MAQEKTLQQTLDEHGGPMGLLWNSRMRPERLAPYADETYLNGPVKPEEFVGWDREMRAWHESAVLFDLTHHMSQTRVSGPDALKVITKLAVNSPSGFYEGRCNQMCMCNGEGYHIADGILYTYAENDYEYVGPNVGADWIAYHALTGGYDVAVERDMRSPSHPNGSAFSRRLYRFQIQGPNAVAIIEELTGKPFPEVKFFHCCEIEIAGHAATGLRHGMAGAAGLEIYGPYEEREAVRDAIIEVGRRHGMLLVGTRAYFSNPLESGWLVVPIPAIYSGASTEGFRAWSAANAPESLYSIEGSFKSDHIEDYYITPFDLCYEKLIKYDHDFIGREALEAMPEEAKRQKVTLQWNGEDVLGIYRGMLHLDGRDVKPIDIPTLNRTLITVRTADEVLRDGKHVGVSFIGGFIPLDGAVLSLACVDRNVQVGDELVVMWGTAGQHDLVPIRATVTPTPYDAFARENYRK